jgi:hypothetical protein
VIVGLSPWTPALIGLLQKNGRQALRETYTGTTINVPLMLIIWCIFQFVFFSISKSKLPSYLLPITPAAALLLAPLLMRATDRFFKRMLLLISLIPVSLIALTLFRDQFVNDAYTPGMVNEFALYAGAGGLLFALAFYVAHRVNLKGCRVDALVLMAVLAAVAGSVTASGYESLAASTSCRQLVRDFFVAESSYKKTDPFFSLNIYEQTIPPYLERTVTQVEYLDEMGLGAAAEPEKVRFNFTDFAIEWQNLDRAYAVTDYEQLPRMDFAGLDYRIVAVDLRRVIIARHAK